MRAVLLFLLLLVSIGATCAQPTNVESTLNGRLISKAPKIKAPGIVDYTKVSVSNIDYYLEKGGVELDLAASTKLPEKIVLDTYTNVNCSDAQRGFSENVSHSVNYSKSVSFTKNISSSKQINVSVTLPFGNAGGNASKTVSATSNTATVESVSETKSRAVDLSVASKTALYIKLQSTISSIRVPFKGQVTLDGTATLIYPAKITKFRPSGGLSIKTLRIEKKYRLSDLLNEGERSFPLEGLVEDSKASDLRVSYTSKPLTAAYCNGSIPDSVMTQETLLATNVGSKTKKVIAKKMSLLLDKMEAKNKSLEDARLVPAAANETAGLVFFEEVETEYFGSMTINLGDYYQNVRVRHMSMGPGFCNVTTSCSLGGSKSINAAPGIWSEWQELCSATGKLRVTVSDQVNCDTGVRSQVRYLKE